MQKWSERRARFRELIAGDKCLHPGSMFDPMSARMAEHVGYEMGMFAGLPSMNRAMEFARVILDGTEEEGKDK